MEVNHPVWKDYIKLNLLGSSAFGTVYKAKSKQNDKIVIVKEYSKFQKDINEVYQNEIKNLETLKSDNTINYIKNCETDENYYIIRDYYWGTLEEFVKVHPKGVPPKEIQKILLDLSNAFKKLNEKQYIHREIQPSNILLSLNVKNGYKAILSGIHLAKKFTQVDYYSLRGMRYITPPEAIRGDTFNMKYDLWSVGILIYFMIKGKYPFDGKRDIVVLNQIQNGVKLDISDDIDLNDLLKKTLVENVDQRISWDSFFQHPFLKKQFPGNNNNSENNCEILDLKIKWKNFTNDFNTKKKEILNDLLQYKRIIDNLNMDDIYNEYNENIFKILRDIIKYYDEIINKQIFD